MHRVLLLELAREDFWKRSIVGLIRKRRRQKSRLRPFYKASLALSADNARFLSVRPHTPGVAQGAAYGFEYGFESRQPFTAID